MAQAQKPKVQAQSKTPAETSRKPPAGWVWLALGVTIGLFSAFLAYLVISKPADENPNPTTANNQHTLAQKTTVTTTQQATPANEVAEPRFSFYTELPKRTLEIPEAEIKTLSGDNEKKPTTVSHQPKAALPPAQTSSLKTNKPSHAYILQAGSFKKHREADQLKAKLALIGVEANIQAVSVNKNDRWFRVRVGPYGKQQQANAVKEKLRKNRIPAIVLKLSP